MEQILITGGSGFIDSHLARHLYSQGNFVRVVDVKFDDYIQERNYSEGLKLDPPFRRMTEAYVCP